jgi:hypothetical protein
MARFIVALVMVLYAGTAAGQTVEWIDEPSEATRIASEHARPLLIHFNGDCAECAQMEHGVYPTVYRNEKARRFVYVRGDGRLREYWVAKLGALPDPGGTMLLDPWGTVLITQVGHTPVRDLLQTLSRVPDSFETIADPMARVQKNTDDYVALLAVGDFYAQRSFPKVAKQFYVRAMQTAERLGDRMAVDKSRLQLGVLALRSKESSEAQKVFGHAAEAGLPQNRHLMLLGLTRAYLQANDKKRAKTVGEELIAKYPDTPSAKKAKELLDTGRWDK